MSDHPDPSPVRRATLAKCLCLALLAAFAAGPPERAVAAEGNTASGLSAEEQAWLEFLELNGLRWDGSTPLPAPWEVPGMLEGPLTWPEVGWGAVDDDPFDAVQNDVIFPGPDFCDDPRFAPFVPLPRVAPRGARSRKRWRRWTDELGAPFDERTLVMPAPATDELCALLQGVGLELIEETPHFVRARTLAGRAGNEPADAQWIGGMFPGLCGLEPVPIAFMPGGSHANIIVVGSSFGRQYDRQPAIRSLRLVPAHARVQGRGVVVAVIDSGLDAEHPLFAGRVLPGIDLVDDDALPAEERDGVDDDGDGHVDEGYGHGTLVAGIVLAAAPKAQILPVRVLDTDGRATSSRIAAGIHHAIEAGADVINLSLGTRRYSRTLSAAVQAAIDAGVLVVAAAGNGGDPWMVEFPSAEYGVVSVSALGVGGRRAGWSNGGRRTSVAAPGRGVIGPYPGTRDGQANWARGTGTSFATPLVSGIAALLIESAPEEHASRIYATLASRWRLNARRLLR